MSWRDGKITLGRGAYIGADPLLKHTPHNLYPVNAISIATADGQQGHWYFLRSNGMLYATPSILLYDYARTRMQACTHAHTHTHINMLIHTHQAPILLRI